MPFDTMQVVAVDVLVVGAGGAGTRAAIEVVQRGLSCALVCKEQLGRSHTCMAEGGLNVSLTDNNPLCTAEVHYADTLTGGADINNRQLVSTFTHETPDRLRDLERYGVLFDRTDDGHIAQRFSGKQTHPLTVFIGDYTGREIMTALVDQVRRLGISVYEEHFVSELLAADNRMAGAIAVNILDGALIHFRARAVILATGGCGRVYRVTTNAASNTGDGYALGLSAGCELIDMEMVQFHPTGMVHPESRRGVLVTESVRGEGGRLFNSEGERFMYRYLPEHLELGGRDEVARAIYSEISAGRAGSHGGVYLSVAHLPAAVIEERLPNMLAQFLATGVDIRREPMEVHPSMHHMMGGLRIDEFGRTTVAGLYACGEVAGGIHGANRLGGNALAECQVFGRRSAMGAVEYALSGNLLDTESAAAMAATRTRNMLQPRPDCVRPGVIDHELSNIMWHHVGIVRDEEGLLAARAALARIREDMKAMSPIYTDHQPNAEWLACLEVHDMLSTAEAIVASALMRRESRGAHYRRDYPDRDNRWDCNVVVRSVDGALKTDMVPLSTRK